MNPASSNSGTRRPPMYPVAPVTSARRPSGWVAGARRPVWCRSANGTPWRDTIASMSPWLELLVAVAMVVGLVGLVVPVLPGLAAHVGRALGVGAARRRWTRCVGRRSRWSPCWRLVGTVGGADWSGRRASGAGAPWWALVLALVGMIVGFFTIPVLGIVVGGVAGSGSAELVRLRHPQAAWDTTWAAIQGYGVGTAGPDAGRGGDPAGVAGGGLGLLRLPGRAGPATRGVDGG